MHLLQYHPRIEDTFISGSSIFTRPTSRRVPVSIHAREKASSTSPPREDIGTPRGLGESDPVLGRPKPVCRAENRSDCGEVFKIKVLEELVPQSFRTLSKTNESTGGDPPNLEVYSFAVKDYAQSCSSSFESERNIFNVLRSNISNTVLKVFGYRTVGGVLELEFAGGSGSGHDSGGSSGSVPNCSSNHQSSKGLKRSSRRDDDFSGEESGNGSRGQGDDRKDDKNTGTGAKKLKTTEDQRKLACPYFKHDPVKFNGHRTCCGPGFNSVHRVKEHIFRKHVAPRHYCRRCRMTFNTETEMDDHMRSDIPCGVSEKVDEGRCTEKQLEQLKSRSKYSRTDTEENKWRSIYGILFPDDINVPSPYYDDLTGPEKTPTHEADKLAEHLRRELPSQLRQEIQGHVEKEFGLIEDVMRTHLADIVQNVSHRILETFRKSPITTSATCAEMTSKSESTRGSLLGEHTFTTASTVTDIPVGQSARSMGISEQGACIPPPYTLQETFDPAKWGDFDFDTFLSSSHLDNQKDLEQLEELHEQNPELNLLEGFDSYHPMPDAPLLSYKDGLSGWKWDAPDKTASSAANGDNASEQEAH